MADNIVKAREKKKVNIDKKKLRLPKTICIAVGLWMVFMAVVFAKNDIPVPDYTTVDENMIIDAYYSDGRVEHNINVDSGGIYKGDRIVVQCDIPDDAIDQGAELYFILYNSIVNVYLDGKPLYQDEYEPENISKHYGGRIYEVSLPVGYKDKNLVVEITSVVYMPFTNLSKMKIVSANEGWKNLIAGRSVVFCTSLSLMILALISVFYFIVRSISLKKMQLGLPIALFEMLINAWFFGSINMFYLISSNVEFCAKVEYYALYLAPIPLAIFIYSVLDVPAVKKMIASVLCIYSIYYIVATAVELSTIQQNYSDLLSSMHIISGITIAMMVIAIFAGTKHESNTYQFILRYGVLISMLCGIAELIRFNVTKYILRKSWFATHGLSIVAIVVIALSLIIYLISINVEEYTFKIEQKQLMALAYKDALTEMPNRAECYRQIEEMEANDIKDYTMVFIDLNNLKTANDVYGHDMGDDLLKVTADNIMAIFSENGFCSRWGGDEFVACVFGEEDIATVRVKNFVKLMEETDKSGRFPFEVSAACGCKHSTKAEYLAPIEAIRLADEMMYANKKVMKAASV